jgi:flagellar protein FlaG
MKVQGVDPTIMNRIEEQIRKQSVHETKHTVIAKEQERQKRKPKQNQMARDGLAAAVDKLNKMAETLNISLFFQIEREDDETVVLVIDKDTEKVIRRIPPDKTLTILTQMQFMVGMLVDQML